MATQASAVRASGDVEKDETSRLIASNKVEGTQVYNRAGEHLGEVYNLMVDKFSGQVAYAVMSFGGFGDRRALPSAAVGIVGLRCQSGRLCRRSRPLEARKCAELRSGGRPVA